MARRGLPRERFTRHRPGRVSLGTVTRPIATAQGRERTRRVALAVAASVVLLLGAAPAVPARRGEGPHPPLAASPVAVENARAGDPGWLTTEPQPADRIEGYTASPSLRPGETLAFHISTRPAAGYRVEIYRLGYYGGDGARRVACLPTCDGAATGAPLPVPLPDPLTGQVDAAWPATDSLTVPDDWLSGYYTARLTLTDGDQAGRAAYVPFVVRAPDTRRAPIIVQAPVNTWQAYNEWGGTSLYAWAAGPLAAATRVSFDRPLDPVHNGTRGFLGPFSFEYPLVRFLEKQGYDLSYTTDLDVDAAPRELLRHRLVIVPGHSEYWTATMRDALQAARDRGTNLLFAGANDGYWQARYTPDRRSMISFKQQPDPIADPALRTTRFRDLTPPQPECRLVGTQYSSSWPEHSTSESLPPRDYAATGAADDDPWFAGTGFQPGDLVKNTVWYEWDTYDPACLPGATVLFHSAGAPASADAVRYTAPSGARVFSGGSLGFAAGLSNFLTASPGDDARLGAFMRNALDDLQRPAAPRSVAAARHGGDLVISVALGRDPRVRRVVVLRHPGAGRFTAREGRPVCRAKTSGAPGPRPGRRDAGSRPPGVYRYAALAVAHGVRSALAFSAPVDEPATAGRGSTAVRIDRSGRVRLRAC